MTVEGVIGAAGLGLVVLWDTIGWGMIILAVVTPLLTLLVIWVAAYISNHIGKD